MKLNKRTVRRLKKSASSLKGRLFLGAVIVVSFGMMQRLYDSHFVDPAAYVPLLNVIAKGESGGNYNAYFGSPKNSEVKFTGMTISEVLEWQDEHVKKGNISSAVGKYQIVNTTLRDIVRTQNIDQSEKFDEAMQDKMAVALLERRGAQEYVNNKLSKEEFAANLAKEWAALPKAVGANPHESYYASDGVNKSNTSVDEVYDALGSLQQSAKNKNR